MSSLHTLALSAVVGLMLGLGLVWVTIKPPPPGMTQALPESASETETEPDTETEPETEPEAETQTDEPETDAEAVAQSEALDRRVASEPTLRLRRGRVAYIRCGARSDCPRDRDFESAAWAVLESLPTCPDGPRSPGTGDVRVHFTNDGVELRFRDWGNNPVALRPLRTCLESQVTTLRTRLGVRPLTVSFRFELRALR